MSEIVAPRFVPWLRTGLAADIEVEAEAGLAPASSVSIQASVQLCSTGDGEDSIDFVNSPDIELLGPAHVVALDPGQIVRRDPVPGADDAEPNYFACVELASADLPWRFTPAAADGDERLQPWLVLVVVEDREGISLAAGRYGLDVLTIDDGDGELPDLTQSWAWAHVHADDAIADGDVAGAFSANGGAFHSRLMCPRRLPPNTAWIAALVPSFEVGRAAGLRISPESGRLLSWTSETTAIELPVYSSWRFKTGPSGDFESLVRRLTPRELPSGVGRRTLDLSNPRGGLPSIKGATTTYVGALVSPSEPGKSKPSAGLLEIQEQLPKLLNATVTHGRIPSEYDALEHDPVVGPTIHAAHQAGQRTVRLLDEQPIWFGHLNIEPHHRAAAGLGAEIVRRDQEALMGAAWEQAATMRPVNDLLRRARAAWEIVGVTQDNVLALSDATLLHIAAPAAGRLRFADGTTMASSAANTGIPGAMLSTAFRRRCAATPSLAGRTGSGVRIAPTHTITSACLADPPAFVAVWSGARTPDGAGLIDEKTQTDQVHFVEEKVMDRPASQFPTIDDTPGTGTGPVIVTGPVNDTGPISQTGPLGQQQPRARRQARRQTPRSRIATDPVLDDRIDDVFDDPIVTSNSLTNRVRTSLDARGTIAAMLDARIGGLAADRDHQAPAGLTAHPVFTTPMYAQLAALNPEFLMPGVGSIPDDTVALAEVNSSFIEAYLTGLNHEMGRELLWREYPARLDETWFRQFWDSVDGSPDIVEIESWTPKSVLGSHAPDPKSKASLVLLVTGALLRRYPDTKVYTVAATWAGTAAPREEDRSADADIKLPLFTGNLGPGIRFFGFDLDEAEARGSDEPGDQQPGYFFVFEEQPHAPRFGFDKPDKSLNGTVPASWIEMSWSHLVAQKGNAPAPTFVDLDARPRLDSAVDGTWGDNSATMANIAFQRPVRMLVHADSMLPPGPSLPGGFDPGQIDPGGGFDPTDPFGSGGPFDPTDPFDHDPTRPPRIGRRQT